MIRHYSNKMQKKEENKKVSPRPRLLCKQTVDMPGLGHFEKGQEILCPFTIVTLQDHPNFEVIYKDL